MTEARPLPPEFYKVSKVLNILPLEPTQAEH